MSEREQSQGEKERDGGKRPFGNDKVIFFLPFFFFTSHLIIFLKPHHTYLYKFVSFLIDLLIFFHPILSSKKSEGDVTALYVFLTKFGCNEMRLIF